jgi:hypothetical protein
MMNKNNEILELGSFPSQEEWTILVREYPGARSIEALPISAEMYCFFLSGMPKIWFTENGRNTVMEARYREVEKYDTRSVEEINALPFQQQVDARYSIEVCLNRVRMVESLLENKGQGSCQWTFTGREDGETYLEDVILAIHEEEEVRVAARRVEADEVEEFDLREYDRIMDSLGESSNE